MVKIVDRFKLDAEELKRELMAQPDEYRRMFDEALRNEKLMDEERLKQLNFIWNCSAAIYNFLSQKAGIDIRTGGGGMASTDASGYYMAKIMDVEQRYIKKSEKLK